MEDLAAYVYAVMAHPGYQRTFATELTTPGPRIPITTDPAIFQEAVAFGSRLLWLHTWGDRYRGKDRGAHVPVSVGWSASVTTLPSGSDQISYDADSHEIHVGDGIVTGVRREVWEFSISGFPVVQRWLQSRTASGVGRSSSPSFAQPLDKIRPIAWEDEWNDELLELLSVLTLTIDGYHGQAELLDRIRATELITASELPEPTAAERKVPKTI
ncbi:hypothetical protein BJF82_12530 [Kytococcus sp. CUA-901]|nr:hypothetical protein BJF82_12530 [Kytococcus sp. CUA-901]